jgi:predicted pyridoxine 5'-phosphate oxidase superfamily flavin-nucleotide-binding protein
MTAQYHEGELAIQSAAGEVEAAARIGRAVGRSVVSGAVAFIESLSVAVVASVDGDGQPWCSMLIGPRRSFLVPEPGIVALQRQAQASVVDPLWDHLRRDRRIGLLFIDPGTRRRYRVNGRVRDPEANPLIVEVAEAYPNCPKYVQRRHLRVVPPASVAQDRVAVGRELTRPQQQLLARTDTLFMASANPRGELDASHRGGAPGFVAVLDERRLWIPDYAGNNMFNTMGNLHLEPRAGLLVFDFVQSEILQLAGTVAFDLAADPRATGGTGRAWMLTLDSWRQASLGARLQQELLEYSPHNPPLVATSGTRAGRDA